MADTAVEEISLGGGDAIDYSSEPAAPPITDDDQLDRVKRHIATADPPPRTRSKAKKENNVSYDDPDDQRKHTELIVILARFANSDRFAAYLSAVGFTELTPSKLRQRTIDELEELKTRVTTACLNRTSGDLVSGCVAAACQGVELACKRTALGKHLFLALEHDVAERSSLSGRSCHVGVFPKFYAQLTGAHVCLFRRWRGGSAVHAEKIIAC